MSNEMLIALLGFLGTLIGSLTGTFGGMKLYAYRIDVLEKRAEKLEQRVDDVEKQQIVVVQEIKVMKEHKK